MRSAWRWGIGVLVAVGMLMAPAAAMATDFSLGGYVAMYTIWDSTQTTNNLRYMRRSNNPDFEHGRLRLSAERTRMNFTMKGPKIWGARTTGFIEIDFDQGGNQFGIGGVGWASPQKARPRMRHAMFRLTWPATELLMGQYWSLLSFDPTEAARPGTSGIPGITWFRVPQIRLTQKFMGCVTMAIAVSDPLNGPDNLSVPGDQAAVNNQYLGESSETPRVSGSIKFQKDLWGKAAFYGKPRPFSAQVAVGWQRTRYRTFTGNGRIFGQNTYNTVVVSQSNQQYLDPWVVAGSLFIPLVTTDSANLAHTMSLLAHIYVGQGLDVAKEASPANSSYLVFNRVQGGVLLGERQLAHQWGGLVQLQYYITNQWYINLLGGMQHVYGVDRDRWIGTTTAADPPNYNEQAYITLWYRPIQALKFGVEYGYARTGYFQYIQRGSVKSDYGDNHEVLFVGFFFF
jgi:hypothetical protein